MENKKKNNWFLKIIGILFFVFIIIYCLRLSGYYEAKMHDKSVYTSKQIQKFEEDIKDGKEVDVKEYLPKTDKNYANVLTKTSDKIDHFVNKIMSSGINGAWKTLKILFW
jgi:hypothetical protein